MTAAGALIDHPHAEPAARAAASDRLGAETTREKMLAALQVARPFRGDDPDKLAPYEATLVELLDALGWSGSAEHLVEVLPHVDPIDGFVTLATVLERLGVVAAISRQRPGRLSAADFPAAYLTRSGPKVAETLEAYEARDRREDLSRWSAELCSVRYQYVETKKYASRPTPFRERALSIVKDDLIGALWLTALVNSFALALPLYAISVYNMALPASATESLLFFTALAVIALITEDYFRAVRGRLIANMASRLHSRLMAEAVQKRLTMPLGTLERVSTAALLAQFKRMENLLGFFQSGNAKTLIDTPFVVLFLVVLALIGGWIVLVPLAAIAAIAAVAALFPTLSKAKSSATEISQWETRDLMRETITHDAAIREAGVETLWLERVSRRLHADAERHADLDDASDAATQIGTAIIGVSAAATLGFGAYLVIAEQISIGALMAATILNMRILSPVNAFAQSIGTLRDVREDLGMIEQILAIDDDARLGAPTVHRRFEGELSMVRVGHRLQEAQDFALRNVSLNLSPGERLAIVGPGGSGRSLLLRVAVGLTTPTLGTVRLDGLPLSQIAAEEQRRIFAYAPGRPEFLYGTIAQNMRFARMDVGDFEIEELLEALGLPLHPEQFPDGLETRLTEVRREQLGVTALQKLNIARAILSNRPVLALDNVFADLDGASRRAVLARLEQTRATQSVIIAATHRDVVEACDTTLALKQGAIVAYGPTAEVMRTITQS